MALGSPLIVIDSREPYKVVQLVKQFHPAVVVQKLAVGDFATDKVVVERKEVHDLASSIITDRIKDQLLRLSHEPKHQWLIIHGSPLSIPDSVSIKTEHLLGFVASVTVRYGINVCWLRNLEEAIYVIIKIIKKVHEGKLGIPYLPRKRIYSRDERVRAIRLAFRVSEKVAKGLLKKFGSLRGICNASEKELKKVDGVGDITAKRIHTLCWWKNEGGA